MQKNIAQTRVDKRCSISALFASRFFFFFFFAKACFRVSGTALPALKIVNRSNEKRLQNLNMPPELTMLDVKLRENLICKKCHR